MRGWIIVVGLLTAGCTPAEHKAAEEAVRQSMKDPDAAQFKNIKSVKTLKAIPVVCGEVNGKNSYGGFVGFKRFAYYPSTGAHYVEDEKSHVPDECLNAP